MPPAVKVVIFDCCTPELYNVQYMNAMTRPELLYYSGNNIPYGNITNGQQDGFGSVSPLTTPHDTEWYDNIRKLSSYLEAREFRLYAHVLLLWKRNSSFDCSEFAKTKH